LGPPEDFPEKKEKIFIRQLWSSPLVFRRASKDHTLCDDAKAFNTEARRRVQKYRDTDGKVSDGDRILILGEDEDPKKQEGLDAIVVKADTAFNTLNGASDTTFSAYLLAPQPKSDDEEEEEIRTKNNSSVILQFTIGVGKKADACKFLTGGDAGVAIWERLWARHKKNPEYLVYDVLLTPHHCSWHTLSYDSISDKGEDAEVSKDAKSALSQTRKYARLIASCKKIKDDNDDPPSHRAAEEYRAIAKKAEGSFDETSNFDGEPLELDITEDGPSLKKARRQKGGTTSGSGAIGGSVLGHG
ncbi:MAG: metallohydrolase, partial [Nevskia sp.]|nr:metallohydrolase [Nevskia sp.]